MLIIPLKGRVIGLRNFVYYIPMGLNVREDIYN